ncbi:MAG: thioredoxin family protein [Paludibacteraceae bacterium]|nr:thioredoxin family protein [Paludibacteraceae bacterium]
MKKAILFILALLTTSILNAQIQKPVKWDISCSGIDKNNTITISFKANIDDGWHIYGMDMPKDGPIPTSFNYTLKRGATPTGSTTADKKTKCGMDNLFGMELCEYSGEVTFQQKMKVSKENGYKITGYVEYMACDNTNCLSPTKEEFSFEMAGQKKEATAAAPEETKSTPQQQDTASATIGSLNSTQEANDTWKPVIDQMNSNETEGEPREQSLLGIFLLGLLGGLLAVLTPCVWPIIPTTVSIFMKQDGDERKGKISALLFGASIILIYVGLGIILTLLFGANVLNDIATGAFINILLFVLLVVFAIAFFGGFELSLPASWSTKLENKADESTGIVSILFMALTLVIVSFSCTGPLIGTLLVDVSSGHSILPPVIGMLGFSIALAVPFTLFAFFPSLVKKRPKSGSWLNTTKVLLGFFELAFAFKFLSVADMSYGWGILSRETFLCIWIVIFAMAGFYILGKIRFKDEEPLEGISVWRLFGGGAALAFAIYLVPGLWGAPLKAVSAFAPPIKTQDFNLQTTEEAQFNDYDEAIAYAQETGKPILVDFTGYGCVNCRKMETAVWNKPRVSELIDNDFILVSLFVDDKRKLPEPLTLKKGDKEVEVSTYGEKWSFLEEYKFGANAQPFYVILDKNGNALSKSMGFTEEVDKFVKFLQDGLEKHKEANSITPFSIKTLGE